MWRLIICLISFVLSHIMAAIVTGNTYLIKDLIKHIDLRNPVFLFPFINFYINKAGNLQLLKDATRKWNTYFIPKPKKATPICKFGNHKNMHQQRKIKITWPESFFSFTMKYRVARNKHIPWPQSPNMTAKRKGKVTIVYTPGFASWYLATLP